MDCGYLGHARLETVKDLLRRLLLLNDWRFPDFFKRRLLRLADWWTPLLRRFIRLLVENAEVDHAALL